jgi:nitrite reductase/ring-hydroxylating ferredoxin subunit
MATDEPNPGKYVHVAALPDLEESGRLLVTERGRSIALFYHDGEVRAVDNRCPHMGFPLTEGTVEDGVLTCHWHHARFELSCGDTFDPWADDVPTYPVEVRDDEVWVCPEPRREQPPAEHWADRLSVGLEETLELVVAKSVIGLADAGVEYTEPFERGLDFGTRYREDGWSRGLTVHTALANLREDLDEADRKRAMYTGLSRVAADCAGEPPRFAQSAFSARDLPKARLKEWFRDNVEVRDADGAERALRTAIETLDEPDVAEILFSAATDYVYLDSGHTLDFCTKAFEALDHVGFERAPQVLPSLVDALTDADRAEESAQWRQPVDLAELLFDAHDRLPEAAPAGGAWHPPSEFVGTLLGNDPEAIVEALVGAVEAGATPADLAAEVVYAAALRVCRFSTGNEFGDWNTVHHTYTYANAVHGATARTDAPELYRGVFDAALKIYLDRFLNTPAADLPEGDPTADPEAALSGLERTFEEADCVDEAGRCVADYLAGGGDVETLTADLGGALLREDAGFHTIQNVEVGVRQARRQPDRARIFLIAAARYLAAHTPTRREAEQTYTIAARLNRGERIHDD